MPHTPYSSDLAPMDHYLFLSLSDHLCEKKFDDDNDVKIDFINFFDQKSKDFYERPAPVSAKALAISHR